ncbi:MAG: tRNA (N6-threonylcarbamoyladenosine(37)-N6)-methyltransferase TrmO [Clostridia bacterium]|nr:tRNA (N6-threonylcarbamoyladenosine(37)-N6)-methyltransferase TrmO [Clostridia bacterium]
MNETVIRPVARIYTDFPEKFGIPRQSGLISELCGRVVFEEEFRRPEALRRIEEFSHLWLIWQFSKAVTKDFRPTVRPPRLGGNERVGVFASRAPYRPNSLALSCVRLLRVDWEAPDGPALIVGGVDMLSGTPVFDVKPYIPVADCHSEATQGYTKETREHALRVEVGEEFLPLIPADKLSALRGVLAGDPRPGYEDDPDTVYGMSFAGMDVGFTVSEGTAKIVRINKEEK